MTMTRWFPPPAALAVAVFVMWAIARGIAFGRFDWPAATALGIALIVLGLALAVAALRLFARAHTTPNPMRPREASELVTSGVYALTRNPMYLGDAIMLAGIALYSGHALNVLPLAAFVAYIDRMQIAAEERALQEVFGERYAAYRRRVGRWL